MRKEDIKKTEEKLLDNWTEKQEALNDIAFEIWCKNEKEVTPLEKRIREAYGNYNQAQSDLFSFERIVKLIQNKEV